MEEQVGLYWHRLITRLASPEVPQAAVGLQEVSRSAGVLFRALGGARGLRVEAARPTRLDGARRTLLQRAAGSGRRAVLAWCDHEALYLPERLAVLPTRALNRELYFWLAALAAVPVPVQAREDWLAGAQRRTLAVLARYPGLRARYLRLVQAYLPLRPEPARLAPDAAAQEAAIRAALREPGSVAALPPARRSAAPVALWLHPEPPRSLAQPGAGVPEDAEPGAAQRGAEREHEPRLAAERVDAPQHKGGLLAVRLENIFSWSEFVKVDRGTDEDDPGESARDTARDLDVISVARDRSSARHRVRFDLDLPAPENDDAPLGSAVLLPEWDYRRRLLVPDYCALQPMVARRAEPCALPARLRRTARRLRAQFEALAPARSWRRAAPEGADLDLDACLQFAAERAAGRGDGGRGLYRALQTGNRDLACLLLADLSLSTDSYVNDHARVIDVIRDALLLFGESLAATGDRFAMFGFSSRKRQHVRFHVLKTFAEPYGGAARGRLQAIRPGYYTRMGAALRHATALLEAEPARRRLLLLLTDGKPNDLDRYEGRYGIEDTRMALAEARRRGLQPFCVTIDARAGDYLPHLFGSTGYVVIRRPAELPRQLPLLYAQLAR